MPKHKYHEEEEQALVIEWARYARVLVDGNLRPLERYLLAIPNGAYLGGTARQRSAQMWRLKRVGLRSGAGDLLLTLARGSWFGFFIEMKKRRNQFRYESECARAVSDDQKLFGEHVLEAGYLWMVVYGFDEAKAAIERYLAGRDPRCAP